MIYSRKEHKMDGKTKNTRNRPLCTLEMLPLSEFSKFHCELETNNHIDFDETKSVRLTDEEAKRIIEKISGCKTVEEYQELPQKKQIELISEFRNRNISIRQINRLTGLSIGIVRKY